MNASVIAPSWPTAGLTVFASGKRWRGEQIAAPGPLRDDPPTVIRRQLQAETVDVSQFDRAVVDLLDPPTAVHPTAP